MRRAFVCAFGAAALTGCSLLVSLDGLNDGGALADSGGDSFSPQDAGDASDPSDAGDASPAIDAATVDAGAYANAVLADAPIAYYRLDDTGKIAVDFAPHHLNGMYEAATTLGTHGLIGTDPDDAVSFNGNPDGGDAIGILVPRNALLEPTSGISVEAWIRMSELTDVQIASYDYQPVSPYQPWVLQVTDIGGGTFVPQFFGSGLGNLSGNTLIQVGTVYHLVGTFDGTALTVFVNGIVDTTKPTTVTFLQNYDGKSGLSIGSAWNGDFPFYGVIDEVAIYDHALTAARVAAHYAAGTK